MTAHRSLRLMLLLITPVLTCVVLEAPAFAKDPATDAVGFTPNHAFDNGLAGENVDLMSGNLSLTIPIGPRYMLSDRYGYQVELQYNSKLWDHECTEFVAPGEGFCPGYLTAPGFPQPGRTYGLGFDISFGKIYQIDHSDATLDDLSTVWKYQSPDGADHHFCAGASGSACKIDRWTPGANNAPGTYSEVICDGSNAAHDCAVTAFDGSGTAFSRSGNTWYALPGDGTRVTFDLQLDRELTKPSQTAGVNRTLTERTWYATRIESLDKNGTTPVWSLDIAYDLTSGRITTIQDSAGRTISLNAISGGLEILMPSFGNTTNETPSSARARYVLNLTAPSGDKTISDPGPAGPSRDVRFLTSIEYPLLSDPASRYKFQYTDGAGFGYLSKRTLPTGAEVSYQFRHFGTKNNQPLHSEIVYKELTLPSSAPGKVFRWAYTRFGDATIRSSADLTSYLEGHRYLASNPNKVRVLDPFDNLTVYNFRTTYFYPILGDYTPGCNNGNSCPKIWDDGLLDSVVTYFGAEEDSSRLVHKTEYEYTHEGMFPFRTPASAIAHEFAVPINARRIKETVTTPGSVDIPTTIRTTEYSDWISPLQVPKARLMSEFANGALYRTTYTDYVEGDTGYGEKHRFVEMRDQQGALVSAVSRKFTFDRLDCEQRHIASPGLEISDCSGLTVAPGDVIVQKSYSDSSGIRAAPVSTTISGGDASTGGAVTTTLTYVGAYPKTRKYGSFSWSAFDRIVDANTGLATRSIDPAGTTVDYTWDALGRLTSINPGSGEKSTTITYPTLHQTEVRQDTNQGPDNYTKAVYKYDDLGRMIEERRRNASMTYDVRSTEYDIANRIARQSEWYLEGTAFGSVHWNEYDYSIYTETDPITLQDTRYVDPLGRLHKTVMSDGAVKETEFDGLVTRVTVRGIAGRTGANVPTLLDATTVYRNDEFGRLVELVSPGGGARASYGYDLRDNLTAVQLSDSGIDQRRTFVYDALGRLRRATSPESGGTDYTRYDSRGNLVELTDAKGHTFLNTYDAAGRLTQRKFKVSSTQSLGLLSNTYDALTAGECPGGALSGKLAKQMNYRLGKSALGAYASSIHVSTQKWCFGAAAGNSTCVGSPTNFSGLNGRLKWNRLFVKDGTSEFQTDYCQNELGVDTFTSYPAPVGSTPTVTTSVLSEFRNGYLVHVKDTTRLLDYVTAIQYAPGGAITDLIHGSGMEDQTLLDVRNRPSRIRYWRNCPGGGSGSSEFGQCGSQPTHTLLFDTGVHSYDGAGNVAAIGTDHYYYDPLSRLVGGQITKGLTSYALNYSYDAFGNMLRKQQLVAGGAGTDSVMDVDPLTNRLIDQHAFTQAPSQGVQYTYDDVGNLVAALSSGGDGRGYGFDVDGRMENVADDATGVIGTYYYDGGGNRVYARTGNVETYYVRDTTGRVLSEFKRPVGTVADPTWDKDYVYGAGRVLSLVKNENPPKPTRLWITPAAGSLTLNWTPVDEPDLLGYGILVTITQSNGVVTSLDASAYPGTTSYLQATLSSYVRVVFELTTYDTAGNHSEGTTLIVNLDATAPVWPASSLLLTAVPGDKRVELTWAAVNAEDWQGYRVLRTPSGTWLTPQAIVDRQFVDLGLTNGQAYTYSVYAVDTYGNQSAAQNVTVTPTDLARPLPPVQVFALPDLAAGTIRIGWLNTGDPGVTSYAVYRDGATLPVQTVDSTLDSILDTGLGNATTHTYVVKAVDVAEVLSVPSAAVSAKTRSSAVAGPTNVSVNLLVDTMGTTSTDGPNGYADGCNTVAEDDDRTGIAVAWNPYGVPLTSKLRVYRAPHGTNKYVRLTADVLPDSATLHDCSKLLGGWWTGCVDYNADSSSYDYYVVAAAAGTGDESPAAGIATSSSSGVFQEAVRNVTALDGYFEGSRQNRRSEHVTVNWSRVSHPDLRGYNVYRRCELFRAERSTLFFYSVATPTCSRYWERLTTQPVSSAATSFEDTRLGGTDGVYVYAVRAVGNGGVEGPISKAVEAYLPARVLWDEGDVSPRHCMADTETSTETYPDFGCPGVDIPYCPRDPLAGGGHCYVECIRVTESSAVGISQVNSKLKGTGTSDGSPSAPTDSSVESIQRMMRQHRRRVESVRVNWTYPTTSAPRDLAGFRIEMAGSANGPWNVASPNLVAWWERSFDYQGVGVEKYLSTDFTGYAECKYFRVRAVDEDGNASDPSAPQAASACRTTPALPAPENLKAMVPLSTDPSCGSGTLGTRLEWTAVANATAYNVYRFHVDVELYFYLTAIVPASASTAPSFVECGDDTTQSTNVNLDCPLAYGTGDNCSRAGMSVFFVTAVDSGPGESNPSNTAKWDTGYDPYVPQAAHQPVDRGEGIAQETQERSTAMLMSARYNPASPSVSEVLECRSRVLEPADEVQLQSVAANADLLESPSARDANVIAQLTRARLAGVSGAPMVALGQTPPPVQWTLYDFHVDHLGSTRMVTKGVDIFSRHDFFPFGEEIQPMLDFSTHMFTGHERDRETGLDYMMARYYSNSMSRFLSTDPAGASRHSAGSWNKYTYAMNNPLNLIDPDGRKVTATHTNTTYPVSGTNLAQVASKITKYSGFASQTSAQLTEVKPTVQTSTAKNADGTFTATSTVKSVDIKLETTTDSPAWTGVATATAGAKTEWNRFAGAVAGHESGHVSIAVTDANALDAQLVGTTATGSGTTADAAKAAATGAVTSSVQQQVTQASGQTQQAQNAYDAATQHGGTQGAVLDTSKK